MNRMKQDKKDYISSIEKQKTEWFRIAENIFPGFLERPLKERIKLMSIQTFRPRRFIDYETHGRMIQKESKKKYQKVLDR